MIHFRHRHALVSVLAACALLVPGATRAAAPSAGTRSGDPRGVTSRDFYNKTKAGRAAAIRQARDCTGAGSDCRAFQPSSADDFRPSDYGSDHVIARFTSKAKAHAYAKAHGSKVLGEVGKSHAVILSVPKGKDALAFARSITGTDGVKYAEPDFKLRAFSDPPQKVDWGVRAIKADDATIANSVTGAGVTVAVVDTGVDYTHPDLNDNIKINTAEDSGDGIFDPHSAADNNGVDDDGNGFVDDVAGYDFSGKFFTSTEPDNNPMDVAGHGTHVSGIIAAEDNSIGVRGVAPGAKILPVRVLDDGGFGFDSTIAEGIYYAVDNGANIINISLGGYGTSSLLRQAVEYAAANNVSVVAAAGNSFFYSLASYPAAFPSVISVAAAPDVDPSTDDESLTKVWFSDWGHTDFLAPGVNVLSTTPDNTYSRFSGTSMAAPHVVGALALVQESLVNAGIAPTPAKIEEKLATTADDVYFPGQDEVSGAGVPELVGATTIGSADQVMLSRDRYLIPSDGETGSTITLRMENASGTAIPGESISWSTDKGVVSPPVSITDVNGEASTDLTVDGMFGSATVTADPAGAEPARTIRVIVEDDRVRVDDAYVMTPPVDFFCDPFDPTCFVFAKPDPGGATLDQAIPQPGQDVVFRAFLGQHNFGFDPKRADVSWTVTDPSSANVPELSGSLDPVTVDPPPFLFGGNPQFDSEQMTIPFDAVAGKYHLSVTATTQDTGETSEFDKDFYIGTKRAEVLVIGDPFSLDAETFNYFVPYQTDSPIRRAVESLGRSVTYWDPDVMGPPSLAVLKAHPVVFWGGGFFGDGFDQDLMDRYVARGGNLVVSGEQFATNARFDTTANTRYRDLLNATGLLTSGFPDANHQQFPQSVEFANSGPLAVFAGTWSLGAYDLNHTGASTAIFTDELKLYSANGASTLASYPTGINSAGGFEAGTVNDDGFSRVVNLGFGLESINDQGPLSLSNLVAGMVDFFEPPLTVLTVTPHKVKNDMTRSVLVEGSGFQGIGMKAFAGTKKMKFVYLDHGNILVKIPAGFAPGTYDISVLTADGQLDGLNNALKVMKP